MYGPAPRFPAKRHLGRARHLAFVTADIEATACAILAAGSSQQGKITTPGPAPPSCRVLYMRDPEGNLIELEQG